MALKPCPREVCLVTNCLPKVEDQRDQSFPGKGEWCGAEQRPRVQLCPGCIAALQRQCELRICVVCTVTSSLVAVGRGDLSDCSKVPTAPLISKIPHYTTLGLLLIYRYVYCVLLILDIMHPACKDQVFRN